MSKTEYKPYALLIRRFVAIALTLLSVGAMFWPSAVALGGTFRTEEKARMQSRASEYRYLLENYDEDDPYVVARQYTYAQTDLKELIKSRSAGADPGTDAALRTIEQALSEIFRNETVDPINREFFPAVYRAFKNLGLSFEEAREIAARLPYYTDKSQQIWQEPMKDFKDELKGIKYGAIGYNALFFLVIALAAGAVVMMLLNRAVVLTMLHAIFAMLLAALPIGVWLVMLHNGDALLIPGVSAFLVPALAIAACFVYARDKRLTGIFPKRGQPAQKPVSEPQPAPQFVPQEPEAPAADEWICAVCNGRNEAAAESCAFCGSGRTEAPESPRCPDCGAAFQPGMKFCVRCGAKL